MAKTIANPDLSAPALRFQPWKELALYSFMLMELSWTALWARNLLWRAGPHPYPRILLTLGGMYFLMYLVSLFAERVSLRLVFRRIAFAVALLICLVVGLDILSGDLSRFDFWKFLGQPLVTFQDIADLVPMEFLILIIILYICWRGILLAGVYIEPFGILASFRTGIVLFFLHGLVFTSPDSAPLIALDVFLMTSLLALSSARVAVLSQQRGGQSISFDRQWLVGMTLAVMGVVGVAVVIGNMMRGSGFIVIHRIFTVLLNVLLIILTPLVWLAEQFLFTLGKLLDLSNFFEFLVNLFRDVQILVENVITAVSMWLDPDSLESVSRIANWLILNKSLVLWGTIVFFLLIVLLAVGRYVRRRERQPALAEVESLMEQKDLIDLLRDALRRGLGRMMGGLDKLAGLRRARRWLAAARIRRIYALLMDLSAQLNQPRPAARTPLEFLPTLKVLFPGLNAELETITDAYLRVRYGDLPETDEEVKSVEAAWRLVSHTGHDQIRAQKRIALFR